MWHRRGTATQRQMHRSQFLGSQEAIRSFRARHECDGLDEWGYRDVLRGILAEPLLGGALPLHIDCKIYVFGGEATHVGASPARRPVPLDPS